MKDVAKLVGVDYRTIKLGIESGTILTVQPGPRRMIPLVPLLRAFVVDAYTARGQRQRSPAVRAHSAQTHLDRSRYREAVLAARLAVETACGGRGPDVKRRLANASADVTTAGESL